jgi:hypothetical protein
LKAQINRPFRIEGESSGGDLLIAHVVDPFGAERAEGGGVAAALGGEVGSGKIFVME